MPMSPLKLTPRVRAAFKWAAIGFGSLVLLLLIALALIDWNAFKGPIERMASARSGRTITIGGPLKVHI